MNFRASEENDTSKLAPTAGTTAMLVVTRARSDRLAVVNRHGKLTGVFANGDFCRPRSADAELLARPLKQVMTPRPVCIRDTVLAVEALQVFNECSIDDLIVVNARREPVGLVDSQDLPKLKIM